MHYLSFQRAARVPSENLSVVVSKGVRGGEGGGGGGTEGCNYGLWHEGFSPPPPKNFREGLSMETNSMCTSSFNEDSMVTKQHH